jgi:hypothetical protein
MGEKAAKNDRKFLSRLNSRGDSKRLALTSLDL